MERVRCRRHDQSLLGRLALFLRYPHELRFFRSPTATTSRASSPAWTTTRASSCAAPTPSARGAASTSRPTPGRATSCSRRSSRGAGSAPSTRGTTPRPSSRVSETTTTTRRKCDKNRTRQVLAVKTKALARNRPSRQHSLSVCAIHYRVTHPVWDWVWLTLLCYSTVCTKWAVSGTNKIKSTEPSPVPDVSPCTRGMIRYLTEG